MEIDLAVQTIKDILDSDEENYVAVFHSGKMIVIAKIIDPNNMSEMDTTIWKHFTNFGPSSPREASKKTEWINSFINIRNNKTLRRIGMLTKFRFINFRKFTNYLEINLSEQE